MTKRHDRPAHSGMADKFAEDLQSLLLEAEGRATIGADELERQAALMRSVGECAAVLRAANMRAAQILLAALEGQSARAKPLFAERLADELLQGARHDA